jgi:hypothetical protein
VAAESGRDRRLDLRADCTNCFALCCVVPAFVASADFSISKPAGRACPNLGDDRRCTIHSRLREHGFPGCSGYDCFGAGQRISQVTFGGRDPRQDPETAGQVASAYPVMRGLHELLWYLADALAAPAAGALHADLSAQFAAVERLALGTTDQVAGLDPEVIRADVDRLLGAVSALHRAAAEQPAGRRPRRARRAADLVGADLRGADLRAADLRGGCLVGADLRGADLRGADLIGVDLRGADLRGADLTGTIFLTQPQLNAARGDGTTRVAAPLTRPAHWPGARRRIAGSAAGSRKLR